ncbi:MAG TPA: MFS transporter [Thermoplasmata archaeon]|nr:MFS transporter [Thermoplasmata archaeon]
MSAPGSTATPGLAEVARNPRFLRFLGSDTAAAFGGSVSIVAVSWLVYQETHSPIDIALLGLTGFVPGIVLGFLAGVLADRYNRRRLIVLCDLVRAGSIAILVLVLAAVGFSFPIVLGVFVAVNAFGALFTPAARALMPRLVGEGALEPANALLNTLNGVGYTVGGAVGGLTVAYAGALLGLGVNAATYGLSAILLVQIAAELGRPARATTPSGVRDSWRDELAEGFRYLRSNRPVLAVTIASLPANFLASLAFAFEVVYAGTYFPGQAAVYGYLVAAFSAGGALGALAVARLRPGPYAGLFIAVVALVSGLFTLGLVAIPFELPVLVLFFGLGVSVGLINTVYYATVPTLVPNELLARVLSIDQVGSFASIPAALLIGGVITAAYGVAFTYELGGFGLVGIGILAVLWPQFRAFRRAPTAHAPTFAAAPTAPGAPADP